MALSPSDRLGPYEIVEPIGTGGMGAVYRARDTRLGRDVAIKVSAQKFGERFEREARTISSLNHPNICTLYDVGPDYLVMELVQGETLSARLKNGPLPLDEALPIAQQIAEALEAAHEKGVIHRDLKPGNIMLKPDGSVKVLDFGLAKMGARAASGSEDIENSPTISMAATEAGVILGTAGYMSPEQAKGQVVDQRSDVYAFGVVLYEMVTGHRLHHGDSIAETLASVIKEDPDWSRVPPQLDKLLRRCLAKDPKKRQRHIGDVMALVDDNPAVLAGSTPASSGSSSLLPYVLVGGLVVVAAIVLAIFLRPGAGEDAAVATNRDQSIRFEIQPSGGITFLEGAYPTISPDGQWMVFPAMGPDGEVRQYLRALDAVEVSPLPGTESGNVLPPPAFWSPDSKSIAFSSTAGPFTAGQLMRVDIGGGSPVTICDTPGAVVGGTWNEDGLIVFGANGGMGIYQVPAGGGVAELITKSNNGDVHRLPQFLPDGRRFLYFREAGDANTRGVYLGSLDTNAENQSDEVVLPIEIMPRFVPGTDGDLDRLLFLRGNTLFAQPFDPDSLKLTGSASVVTDRVGTFPGANVGLFSISDTGVLGYRVGSGEDLEVTELDRQGEVLSTFGDPGETPRPSLSPDGTQVAYNQSAGGVSDIWVQNLSRGTGTKLTFGNGSSTYPVWSPDGRRIAYANQRDSMNGIYVKNADGTGPEELLYSPESTSSHLDWSKDGKYIAAEVASDIYFLRLEDKEFIPFLATQFEDLMPAISPDGRWVAYASNESGSYEVYVRPLVLDGGPNSASGKWLISDKGGAFPRWRGDGKELYYVDLGLQQMAVDIEAGDSVIPGTPQVLFTNGNLTKWDVSRDGQRFFIARYQGVSDSAPYTIITNWQSGLAK